MWQKPWAYKEGIAIGAGLLLIGALLQYTVGYIRWSVLAYPANVVTAIVYVVLLMGMHKLSSRVYAFRWLGGITSSISALAWTAGVTILMGLTRQHAPGTPPTDSWGFTQLIAAWFFVLPYLWLMTALGLALLRGLFPLRWRRVPFALNHLGLFVAMLGATLGSADMLRLRMTVRMGQAEWRATDDRGKIHELPLAIELRQFTIDEYPPKLMLIDNKTGKTLPDKQPVHLSLEAGVRQGDLLHWHIEILEDIPMAATFFTKDSVRYTRFESMGATYAIYAKATDKRNGRMVEGWVSCGSFAFPHKAQRLDEKVSLVMPAREPQRFASSVDVYTQTGISDTATIEVNKPLELEGWKIYQLSYDEAKGRWSDISTFELVRDPWLPIVYTGIGLMLLGAFGMFAFAQRREKEENHDMG